jgi:hypothetical protein
MYAFNGIVELPDDEFELVIVTEYVAVTGTSVFNPVQIYNFNVYDVQISPVNGETNGVM